MGSSGRVLAIALVLLVPRVTAAGAMQFQVDFPSLSFGVAGAAFDGGGFNDIYIDGIYQETPWLSGFSGNVEFDAGPLLSLTVDDSDPDLVSSHYEFGSGTFTLTAFWSDRFGGVAGGTYVAPLLGLEVDVSCEGELSTVECGGFGSSHGTALALVGPGVFDRELARALGVGRHSGSASWFSWFMDDIDGRPSDAARSGLGLEFDMDIGVAVPEPSLTSLLLLSSLAATVARRRSGATRRRRIGRTRQEALDVGDVA